MPFSTEKVWFVLPLNQRCVSEMSSHTQVQARRAVHVEPAVDVDFEMYVAFTFAARKC